MAWQLKRPRPTHKMGTPLSFCASLRPTVKYSDLQASLPDRLVYIMQNSTSATIIRHSCTVNRPPTHSKTSLIPPVISASLVEQGFAISERSTYLKGSRRMSCRYFSTWSSLSRAHVVQCQVLHQLH